MNISFKRPESVRASFHRLAAQQCDCLHAALLGGTADVHEARKRCKTLRALLRLVRGALDRADFTALDRALRNLARRLSPVRDAEVRRHTFARLLAAKAGVDLRPFAVVRHALDAQARNVGGHTLVPASLRHVTRELATVRDRLAALDLRARGWTALEGGLLRAYARARRPLRDDTATEAARHAWRKAVKTLWYHARFLAGLHQKKMPALAGQLEAVGDLLGEDRDLGLLAAHLRAALLRHAPARVRDPLFAIIAARRAELFREARVKAAEVFDERPRAFTRRLEKWWRRWHR